MTAIRRLLVANRGEIACRVMRTAAQLGIETVAVYSTADAGAPHVAMADHSVCIGPPEAAQSYLVIDKILTAAAEKQADAIHPGYGFLSENAGFARACADAGIIFVGPPPKAIDIMGDKARAKRAMIAAGVPCVPGYQGEDQAESTLVAEAQAVGFPLMVKAAAGGGGRGMRLVHKAEDLAEAISIAKAEALGAFGSDELIIEKAIIRPRHVEIQVFGDSHGNYVHLGERDCSVQRRHQKVIEEAPCPVLPLELREAMGRAAVAAAAAVDYVGAGTVEFLLGEDGSFYFLEMNTRLQVEHPVTEEITGIDLVALQLKVASGGELALAQEDVTFRGHAIEVRLCAEDPRRDFLPSTGKIAFWERPHGPGIRLEAGVSAPGDVPPFYDSLIAKVIATGATREEARQRLIASLRQSALVGPATNRDFLIDALGRDSFRDGQATTAFIAQEYGDGGFATRPSAEDIAMAATLLYCLQRNQALANAAPIDMELIDWASNGRPCSILELRHGDALVLVEIDAEGDGRYTVRHEGHVRTIAVLSLEPNQAVLESDGGKHKLIYFELPGGQLTVATGAIQFAITPNSRGAGEDDEAAGGTVLAPMHGVLASVAVSEGDRVVRGQRLAVLESMKLQHEILAALDGTVSAIAVTQGAQLAEADLIMQIEPRPDEG